LILCIFGNSFIVFAIAMCCLAFGYVGLGVNGNLILTESLHFLKRDKDYQRIYGKGLSIYYVIEAISSVIVTSIYSINPYLPFWISIGIVSFTEVLSLFFKDTRKIPLQNVELKDKTEKKKTYSYKKIFASVFFISLLVYSFVYRGVLSIVTTNFKIYLQQTIEHNLIPLWLFGILIAGAKLMTAIASKYQFKMNLKFGVRTLIILNVLIVLTFFVNGLACLFNPFTIGTLIIIILTSFVQSMIRVPTQIFINNYLNICMPRESIAKCLSVKTMIEYLGYATVSFAYASMLSGFNDNYGLTNLVYIGTFVFPLVLSMVFFLRLLCKEYAKKYTVIKKEYTED